MLPRQQGPWQFPVVMNRYSLPLKCYHHDGAARLGFARRLMAAALVTDVGSAAVPERIVRAGAWPLVTAVSPAQNDINGGGDTTKRSDRAPSSALWVALGAGWAVVAAGIVAGFRRSTSSLTSSAQQGPGAGTCMGLGLCAAWCGLG